MAKIVQAAVVSIGLLTPTKFSNGYPYHKVVFKDIDNGQSYTLNLQKKASNSDLKNYANWMSNLNIGSVLAVALQENNKNVSQYHVFKVISKTNVKPNVSTIVTKETVAEDIISIQLERIIRATKAIEEASQIIEETTKSQEGGQNGR